MVLNAAKQFALIGSPSSTPPSPTAPQRPLPQGSACKKKLAFSSKRKQQQIKDSDDESQADDDQMTSKKNKKLPVKVEKRNARERNRVKIINSTFERLRDQLSSGGSMLGRRKRRKKMSKVDILVGAVSYISMLQELLDDGDMAVDSPQGDADNAETRQSSTPLVCSNPSPAPSSAYSAPSPGYSSTQDSVTYASELEQYPPTAASSTPDDQQQQYTCVSYHQSSGRSDYEGEEKRQPMTIHTSYQSTSAGIDSMLGHESFVASLMQADTTALYLRPPQSQHHSSSPPPLSPSDSTSSVCSNASDGALCTSPVPTTSTNMLHSQPSVWVPEQQELHELFNFASSL